MKVITDAGWIVVGDPWGDKPEISQPIIGGWFDEKQPAEQMMLLLRLLYGHEYRFNKLVYGALVQGKDGTIHVQQAMEIPLDTERRAEDSDLSG